MISLLLFAIIHIYPISNVKYLTSLSLYVNDYPHNIILNNKILQTGFLKETIPRIYEFNSFEADPGDKVIVEIVDEGLTGSIAGELFFNESKYTTNDSYDRSIFDQPKMDNLEADFKE